LTATVKVRKRGTLLRTGHVFCSARSQGKRLKVVVRRLRNGNARCTWTVPRTARGTTIGAAVIVQQGRLRVDAPFRTRVA
jgi:hypothetical protein